MPSSAVRPTLQVVAQRAGVSRQTVSNVVNSPHLVRPGTLQRVQRVIDELEYRPHLAARQMRTRRSHLIGLRVEPVRDGINGVVLDRFLHALTDSAQADGYRLLLFTAADDSAEVRTYGELAGSHDIDAFVLTSTHHGDGRTAWLREQGLPFVTFGRPWGGENDHDWVDVDGSVGTSAAVDHLFALGHRRIAFIGWPAGSGVGDDRRSGWSTAMAGHQLPCAGLDQALADGIDAAGALAADMLGSAEPPTAFVCASDSLALGVLGAARARDLIPGRDVGVVGFDDTAVAQALGLSSVAQPIDAVAAACVRLVRRHLDRGPARAPVPPAGAPTALLVPSLRVRASSLRELPPSSLPDPDSPSGRTQGANL